jgi:hypothetical protein
MELNDHRPDFGRRWILYLEEIRKVDASGILKR